MDTSTSGALCRLQTVYSAGVHDRFESYVRQLCREVNAHATLNTHPLQTVFFGGGTPSLLPPHMLQRVLDVVRQRFGIASDAEVSMEADPGTFGQRRIEQYMALGVNRFSVGVQAFSEDLLEACGRAHTLADVHAAVAVMHRAQPASWSLDLIAGLPGLTDEAWQHSLRSAIDAGAPHVSVYDLQVEEGTPFDKWDRKGTLALPKEDTAAGMLAAASRALRAAGREHYELSNFAHSGHRCAHNMTYWLGHSYYAFGLGAASFLQGRRFSRPKQLQRWHRYVDSVCDASTHASGTGYGYVAGVSEGEAALSAHDAMLESLMLQLRLRDGVSLQRFATTFGVQPLRALLAALQPHAKSGLVRLSDARSADSSVHSTGALPWTSAADIVDAVEAGPRELHVSLADPDGLMLSNAIISDAFAALGEDRDDAVVEQPALAVAP